MRIMSNNLLLSLWITLAGMGLVFASILLLWGVMALLIRLTAPKEQKTPARSPDVESAYAGLELSVEKMEKRRAAVAAVAFALAHEKEAVPHEFLLPPTAIVSAWQAVMRANTMSKRGRVR